MENEEVIEINLNFRWKRKIFKKIYAFSIKNIFAWLLSVNKKIQHTITSFEESINTIENEAVDILQKAEECVKKVK